MASIPAGYKVHYWDTDCLTTLEENQNKTNTHKPPCIIVSIPISQQEFRDTRSSLMWGTPKISCSSPYNNAGKLYGSWITAYLFHVYPTAALLNAKNKIQGFFWGQSTAHILDHYVLYQPHWILLPEIHWHVWIARMIVLARNWMYQRPPKGGEQLFNVSV